MTTTKTDPQATPPTALSKIVSSPSDLETRFRALRALESDGFGLSGAIHAGLVLAERLGLDDAVTALALVSEATRKERARIARVLANVEHDIQSAALQPDHLRAWHRAGTDGASGGGNRQPEPEGHRLTGVLSRSIAIHTRQGGWSRAWVTRSADGSTRIGFGPPQDADSDGLFVVFAADEWQQIVKEIGV